jgi:FtsH-binding integral membrane protein
MNFETESVWDRQTASGQIVSPMAYNLTIGIVLLWGFMINWIIVREVSPEWIHGIGMWPFLIGYFVSCFAGIYLFNSSDNPMISFLGYNLVVVPFGFVINIIVSQYQPSLVENAMRMTAMVTVVMMTLGSLFPRFFLSIGNVLGVSLMAMIVIELVSVFIFGVDHTIFDWIVALIFCGYIGYDWGRSQSIPMTLDNAVDSAAALYMDIINLFIRLLRIMGNKD